MTFACSCRVAENPKNCFRVMVWGAITFWGRTKLTFYPEDTKIDAKEYLDTLKGSVKDMKAFFNDNDFEFMQVCSDLRVRPPKFVFRTGLARGSVPPLCLW